MLFPYSKNSKYEAARTRRSATKLLHLGKSSVDGRLYYGDDVTNHFRRIHLETLFQHALICPQMHATRAGSLRRRATCRARLLCRLWAPGGYIPVAAITVWTRSTRRTKVRTLAFAPLSIATLLIVRRC